MGSSRRDLLKDAFEEPLGDGWRAFHWREAQRRRNGVGNGGRLGKWNLSRVWVKDATHVTGSDIGERGINTKPGMALNVVHERWDFVFCRINRRSSLQGAGSVKITLEGHKTGDRPTKRLLE